MLVPIAAFVPESAYMAPILIGDVPSSAALSELPPAKTIADAIIAIKAIESIRQEPLSKILNGKNERR